MKFYRNAKMSHHASIVIILLIACPLSIRPIIPTTATAYWFFCVIFQWQLLSLTFLRDSSLARSSVMRVTSAWRHHWRRRLLVTPRYLLLELHKDHRLWNCINQLETMSCWRHCKRYNWHWFFFYCVMYTFKWLLTILNCVKGRFQCQTFL